MLGERRQRDPVALRLESHQDRSWPPGWRIEPPPSDAVAAAARPAATAAALPPLEPPGVASRSQGLRVTPKAGPSVQPMIASSGRFGLPDHHGAGRPQASHQLAVPCGGLAERGRAPARDLAGHVLRVLHRDRDSEERPVVAGAAPRVGLVGVRERASGHHDPVRVQSWVEAPDAVEVQLHQLACGDLALPHHPRESDHARECNVVAVHRQGDCIPIRRVRRPRAPR